MELYEMPAHQLAEMLRRRQISARELTEAVLARIEAVDGQVQAYITVTADAARRMADEADRRLAAGEGLTPLTGIPVALKDNLCWDGVRTTCASRILHNFVPPYSATVVDWLIKAGAVIVGKTNLDEFAMGSSTENSAFFVTHNPWDLSRVPGGSSGGSAAAVAAGEAVLALGSDTGGSIRQPAAFCGVVGMKPTYGRVSRFGLVAFASSLDQIGPFARDVEDTALLLQAVAGHDPLDSTSVNRPVPDYPAALRQGVKGLRVGVPREYFVQGIDPRVEQAVRGAVARLEKLGATVTEISLPHSEYAIATYYLIAPAEASSNLARYDGVRYGYRAQGAPDVVAMFSRTRAEGFGAEVKRRIMLGTYALSSGYYDAYYLKAQKVRTLFVQDFQQAFQQVDIVVAPTTPTPPFRIGEKADDPLAMYLSDLFTIPANLAALPAMSVLAGFTEEGLPLGVQFIGPHFAEERLLQAAYALEQDLAGEGVMARRPTLPVKAATA